MDMSVVILCWMQIVLEIAHLSLMYASSSSSFVSI